MITIQTIREYQQEVIDRLKIRNMDAADTVSKVLEMDANRRATQKKLDDVLAESNGIAKTIGQLFKENKSEEANTFKLRTNALKEQSRELGEQLSQIEQQQQDLMIQLPNMPHHSVPAGRTAEDNVVEYQGGQIPDLPEQALPHWELADKYDIIDFEMGNKVTGAGFPFYKGKGARLQRALINFFLDEAGKAGYHEVQPPIFINQDSGYGTGQLPDKEGQMYAITLDNLYAIPTAEVPVTNMYRNVILKEEQFPIKHAAYTPCFRREAGSYGKDVKGLNRLHQFDKVEIVQIQHPSRSYDTLTEMVEHVKSLLMKLELPFRIVRLCGGDMGFTSALTFDFEVYSAAQQRWLEVSSVSNFEAFQANRMKLRYKDGEGKIHLAHTLNGSALALPRIVASLLEDFQTPGGIKVPDVLQPYTGFDLIN